MNATNWVGLLRRNGVNVRLAADGATILASPKAAVGAGISTVIRANKAAIIAELTNPRTDVFAA